MNTDAAVPHHDLHRIMDFNFFPVAEMDDSWWPAEYVTASLCKRLTKIKAVRHKLSDFILQSYQLKSEVYCDFSAPEKQAALLSSTDLKALLYSMGLIIESDTIANAIERKAQQAIQQSLGAEDYLYALKNRISMRSPSSGDKVVPHDNKASDFTDFKSRVYQSGLHCLLSLLDDMPQGFIQRILFKLPKTWSAPSCAASRDDYRDIRTCLPRLFKELKIS